MRPLNEADTAEYARLRREGLHESPLAFSSSPETDFSASPDGVRELLRPGAASVILGAFEDHQLVGTVGLLRARHAKSRHKVQLWGMYVTPHARGRGIARELLAAAIERARAIPGVSRIQLSVTTAASAARRLYERAGFVVWGTEPDALRHDGESVVEHHMALEIE